MNNGEVTAVHPPGPVGPAALAAAAALGLEALAEILTRSGDGIAIVDADQRFVYANPAACQMLGYFLKRLRGQRFLDSFDAREHAKILNHLPRRTGSTSAPFTATACGSEREIAVTAFAIEMAGSFASVLILRDLTSVRAAARTAVVLAQTTAQLVGTGTTTNEILAGIAHHAVEGTRALSAGIVVMGEGRTLSSGGGYGPEGPNYGDASLAWNALAASLGEEVIQAMTGGAICVVTSPANR